MINTTKSREIYNILNTGKIINKHNLNNAGEMQVNDLYCELLDNLDDYRALYDNIGYILIERPSYFYLNDTNINENKTETIAIKIQVLLVIIAKYLNINGDIHARIHSTSKHGLSISDFEKMLQVPHLSELLSRLQTDNVSTAEDLKGVIKKVLVDRNVMLENKSTGFFILSDSGMDFFNNMENYMATINNA